jgi:hypothetical protein
VHLVLAAAARHLNAAVRSVSYFDHVDQRGHQRTRDQGNRESFEQRHFSGAVLMKALDAANRTDPLRFCMRRHP